MPLVITRFGPGEAAVGTVPSYGIDAIEAVTAALGPLADVTGEPPPFVTVAHEDELPAALAQIATRAGELDELQRATMAWWEKAKRHYAARFERWVCPTSGGRADRMLRDPGGEGIDLLTSNATL